MSNDIRTRLAGAIRQWDPFEGGDLVELLLSLPGIAIIQLPEPLPGRVEGELPRWEVGPTVVRPDRYGGVTVDGDNFDAIEARALAARILAAANAAESLSQ